MPALQADCACLPEQDQQTCTRWLEQGSPHSPLLKRQHTSLPSWKRDCRCFLADFVDCEEGWSRKRLRPPEAEPTGAAVAGGSQRSALKIAIGAPDLAQ